jgi:predicted nucleotidyltransferase component of viral defense system
VTERPTRETAAGRTYLDLRRLARSTGRPTDELLQLHALEGVLRRLTASPHADRLILKGGVLLAALDARRPTRDVDLTTNDLTNDPDVILAVLAEVLRIEAADGLDFDIASLRAETIRENDSYSGVRVTVGGGLASARIQLHVDVNVGDPIWPAAMLVEVPPLLGGPSLRVMAYPLVMVLAEKLVTAVQRGTANTRWRDFVDIAALSRKHAVDGAELRGAMERVARHRLVDLAPLADRLAGMGAIAQPKWAAWRRKQRLADSSPEHFDSLLAEVFGFGERPLTEPSFALTWQPEDRRWT